jgi:hypothetical protein
MAQRAYRCLLCRSLERPHGLDFEGTEPKCPRCAAGPPAVQALVHIHLLVLDPEGPILGEFGRRYHVACKPEATNPRGAPCTGETVAVTCPLCKQTNDYKAVKAVEELGPASDLE